MNMDAAPQFATQEPGGPLQTTLDLIQMVCIERGEKHLGVSVVRRQLDIRQADHADTRIFQFGTNQISEVAAHLLRDPITTLKSSGLLLHYSERATSWIS